jgi:glycerol-3-phosphate dehydrogenase
MMRRELMLDRLRSAEVFDVLVIGGGATGLGVAVEAASRGYRVALIERGDFAQGTSSRSTKLVHGGVRYLKQGNVSLVRDALRERGRLLKNAPHLVSNLAFVIPSYTRWNRFFYGTGLKAYDWLAGELGFGDSSSVGREEVARLLPNVEMRGLVGGVMYHDGQFDDARLAVNLAQTAVEHGAAVVNYVECAGLVKEGGRVVGALVRDGESGAEVVVKAKCVVNAAGVFVDAVRRLDDADARTMVTASQGIHLVLPRRFLPGTAALMVPKTADGRVLFAVPWHDHVIVGTTDTPVAHIATEPRALEEERAFVLEHARKYLAEDPQESDVLSVYAGLRPLVKTGGGGSTASLSRDHTIVVSEAGLVTITGGKWTTYRKMGEDVINRMEVVAGLPVRPSITAELRIHGAGEREETALLTKERAELGERIHPALNYTQADVVRSVRQEMARTVEDVLARRTRALLLDAKASIEAAPCVARLLARELGRDPDWVQAQVSAYTALACGYVFTDPASTGSDS